MLSRVADNLYWMSRYLERAEHAARIEGVHLNLMLEHEPASQDRRWQRVLAALGCTEAVEGDAHLAHLVGALDAGGRLANLLNRGQQQADKDRYDGDNHQ